MNLETIAAQLPAGWIAEPYRVGRDLVVLERPKDIGGGYVTIDFDRRIFATGAGTPRAADLPDKTYEGRGWQTRIVADAVAHLNAVMG